MNQDNYPAGWNLERVEQMISHCETQTEEEETAEDEAISEGPFPETVFRKNLER